MKAVTTILTLALAGGPALAYAPDGSDLPVAPRPACAASPVFPKRALERAHDGAVRFALTIAEGGDVSAIVVLSEEPAGYDFGEAAVAWVKQCVFRTAAPGTYQMTVRFRR